MIESPIRHVQFLDRVWRTIHEGPDGRQFVYDDEGERILGVWLIPEDEPDVPLIVRAGEPGS